MRDGPPCVNGRARVLAPRSCRDLGAGLRCLDVGLLRDQGKDSGSRHREQRVAAFSQRDFAHVTPSRPAQRSEIHQPTRDGRASRSALGNGKRSRLFRAFKWSLILGLLGAVVAIVGYWAMVLYFEHRLPEIFKAEDYLARTSQVTRIYGVGDEVISEIGEEKRTVVPADEIPDLIKKAVLAAEDADFYGHDGLDYFGMARAMWKNVRDQRIAQGASTITQQVAKTFFLSSERTMSRKLKEVVLARRLEQKLSKDEILYLYLNQIYWGRGRYGIKEAARHYLRKDDLKKLTLADAALLAGMIAAPERFNPFADLKKATERRAYVLDQMAAHAFVSTDEAEEAKRKPITLNYRGDPLVKSGAGAYANDMVMRFLVEHINLDTIRHGGLRVYTSLDTRLQEEAVAALQRGLRSVDQQYGFAKPETTGVPIGRIPTQLGKLKGALDGRNVRSGEIVRAVVVALDKASDAYRVDFGYGHFRLPAASVTRYLNKTAWAELYRVGDVVRVSPRFQAKPSDGGAATTPTAELDVVSLEQGPQGAVVVMDPKTRHVRAVVGGYDHATHPFNRADQAHRQAGSTFKPFVYGAALESAIFEPTSMLQNVAEVYKKGKNAVWTPQNFSGTYDRRMYSMRMALAKSINVIAVHILAKTGVRRTIDFAKRLGITSAMPENLSLALGSAAVSPLELTNAYATLASRGMAGSPILVLRVVDSEGTVLFESKPVAKLATTPKVAFRLTEMMQAVVEVGTGQEAKALGRPTAGKTGTTNDAVDTWFVGYTPELVAAVWIGFDDSKPIAKASGGKLAAPIWTRLMTVAHEGLGVSKFTPPGDTKPLVAPSLDTEIVAPPPELVAPAAPGAVPTEAAGDPKKADAEDEAPAEPLPVDAGDAGKYE